jgi:serine protease Do
MSNRFARARLFAGRLFAGMSLAALLLATIGPRSALAAQEPADQSLDAREEAAFKRAVSIAAESIVRIDTFGGIERLGNQPSVSGPTTGLIVSAEGDILSSQFAFQSKPASILVTLADGRRMPARQVAVDGVLRMVLLKIDADGLVPATPAPKNTFAVGQWSLALGRTFEGNSPSVSVGIVSALDRVWGKAIQTDAKVSPVNYGGPLIDISGRVLGILAPLSPQSDDEMAGVEYYDSGIGFAVPLVDLLAVVPRLKQGKDLVRGRSGVSLKTEDLYAPPVIDRVRILSPADEAGMKTDDAITAVDGRPVTRSFELLSVMARKYAGDETAFTLRRGDSTLVVKLTLAAELEAYDAPMLGVLPDRAAASSGEGVLIRDVLVGGPAEKALQPRDRILSVGGTAVTTAASLREAISRRRPGDRVAMQVRRGEVTVDVEVPLGRLADPVSQGVRSNAIPTRGEGAALPVEVKTGFFTETMPGFDRDFWAIVPDGYNPQYRYAVLLWLHPSGSPQQKEVADAWKSLCDERGIILVGPQATAQMGWLPNDFEFVTSILELIERRYTIDRRRVVVHTQGNGIPFAILFTLKQRDWIRGIAPVGSLPLFRPMEVEPDKPLHWFFATPDMFHDEDEEVAVDAVINGLRKAKHPVLRTVDTSSGGGYPDRNVIGPLAEWVDGLDRI